jgi:hypothetical protein
VNLGTLCANLDSGISSHCYSLDPKSFILDIYQVNPRQLAPSVGITMTGFCHPGEILNFFFIDISDGAYIAATTSYYQGNTNIKKRRAS